MHTGNRLLGGRARSIGVLSILVLALTGAWTAMQTGWMRGEFDRIEAEVTASHASVNPDAGGAQNQEHGAPLILTIPFAIARTQKTAAEQLKRRRAEVEGHKFFRLNMAGGLLAGLELMQGEHSQPGH